MSSRKIGDVHKAVMRQSLPELSLAVKRGSCVDELDREGRTPLFYAARDGSKEIAAELIRLGANVNAQDRTLETPLHFAARAYQPEVAEMLLKSGAAVDSQDSYGNTPLSRAVFESRGRGQVVKLLLSSGANKAFANKHGVSPEGLAKSIGNYDIGQFFVE
jgi:ankyrin repeat protein